MRSVVSALRKLFDPLSGGTMLAETGRDKALDVIERHGLRANYYMPAIGIQDEELANACRMLASAGYIITDAHGTITGKVATARPSKDELVAKRRASFRLVENE